MDIIGPIIVVITIALILAVTGMLKAQERQYRDEEMQ